MHDNPAALVTGANKGIGLQIAKDLKVFFTLIAAVNGRYISKRTTQ